jgi:hypothetical protein
MVCGTFTLKKVPEAKLAQKVAMYKANVPPPTSVTSEPDGAGTYTITAVWPPCADNVEHHPGGGAGAGGGAGGGAG